MYLVKNTTFDYNFINFSVDGTKFGVLIANVGLDNLHQFGCYGRWEIINFVVTKMCVFIKRAGAASV